MMTHTVKIQPRLVSVEEYERMVQKGVFPKDERLELIEGHIVSQAAAGASVTRVVKHLDALFGDGTTAQLLVSVHDPIRLAHSELQPDLALLKLRNDNSFGGRPTTPDVLLVIEVADTSAAHDRDIKVPLYGRSGVPEAWLIDLSGHTIEVYRRPGNSGYGEKQTVTPSDRLACLALPNTSFSVAEILGAGA
jgi:Uma2 family endonuclease